MARAFGLLDGTPRTGLRDLVDDCILAEPRRSRWPTVGWPPVVIFGRRLESALATCHQQPATHPHQRAKGRTIQHQVSPGRVCPPRRALISRVCNKCKRVAGAALPLALRRRRRRRRGRTAAAAKGPSKIVAEMAARKQSWQRQTKKQEEWPASWASLARGARPAQLARR